MTQRQLDECDLVKDWNEQPWEPLSGNRARLRIGRYLTVYVWPVGDRWGGSAADTRTGCKRLLRHCSGLNAAKAEAMETLRELWEVR